MWMGTLPCTYFQMKLLSFFTSCGFQLSHEALTIYISFFLFSFFTWVLHHFQLKPMSFFIYVGHVLFFLHWSDTKPNLTLELQTKALVSGCWVSIIFFSFFFSPWWGQAMGTGLGSWMQHWWKRFEIIEKTCYLQKIITENYILLLVIACLGHSSQKIRCTKASSPSYACPTWFTVFGNNARTGRDMAHHIFHEYFDFQSLKKATRYVILHPSHHMGTVLGSWFFCVGPIFP